MSQEEQAEKKEYCEKVQQVRENRFKQQLVDSYRPKLTSKKVVLTFTCVGILCFLIGFVLVSQNKSVYENVTRYDVKCKDKLNLPKQHGHMTDCDVLIEVEKDIEGPVYFSYQLDNFYQNHKDYIKSRSHLQLRGQYKTVEQLLDCDPIIVVGDLVEEQRYSLNGHKLPDEWPAIPCGRQAKSFFNDKFKLYDHYKLYEQGKDEPIIMDEKNIAWESDVKYKFKNIEKIPEGLTGVQSWKDIQWLDMTDPHFIVWMRTSGLPTFRKLYGILDNGIKKGKYVVRIDNNFNVAPFHGKKHVVLSTTTSMGGKNTIIANAFLFLGAFCFIYEIIFMIALRKGSKSD